MTHLAHRIVGWQVRNLGTLVSIDKGRVVDTQPFRSETALPYIGADGFGGDFTLFTTSPVGIQCEPTDVLMLWDGERSGLCTSGLSGAIGSTVARLRPRTGVDGRFLYHQLSRHFAWIQGRRTGTGVPHVPKDIATSLELAIPDTLDEQRHITAVLDTVDEAIAKTEAVIAKLKQVRTGLLHDLLTRGLDEHGQLRDPIAHPEQFYDSEVGSIPTTWTVTTFSQCLVGTPQNGVYKPANQIGRGTLLIGQTSIGSDRTLNLAVARRAEVTEPELDRFGLRQNDILISRVFATLAGVGLPAIVPYLAEPAVYESNMMRLRVDATVVLPRLLFEMLKTPRVRARIVGGHLSNQASINQPGLNHPLGIPRPWEQEAIATRLSAHDASINTSEAEVGSCSV